MDTPQASQEIDDDATREEVSQPPKKDERVETFMNRWIKGQFNDDDDRKQFEAWCDDSSFDFSLVKDEDNDCSGYQAVLTVIIQEFKSPEALAVAAKYAKNHGVDLDDNCPSELDKFIEGDSPLLGQVVGMLDPSLAPSEATPEVAQKWKQALLDAGATPLPDHIKTFADVEKFGIAVNKKKLDGEFQNQKRVKVVEADEEE